jgi:hypothetical protein
MNTMLRKFFDNSTRANRARQIYLVLIGLAKNRQTIEYGELWQIIYPGSLGHGQASANSLGCLVQWCKANGLPLINTLVINKAKRLPSKPFCEDIAAEQERVFGYDWFAIDPPLEDELQETMCGEVAA